jgi:hypothetical protein
MASYYMRILNWVYSNDVNADTPEDVELNAKLEDELMPKF